MKGSISLAPLKGITDCIFRTVFHRHFGGVDLSMAPFVNSVQGRRIKAAYLKDLLPENNYGLKLIPQILSKDGDDFIFLAEHLFALGYNEINWNLGCPTPMVAKKHRGSGLLPFPERIEEILDTVMARFPGRISIKTRLGRHQSGEIFKLLDLFNNYPLANLIIHPRLGVQMYKGGCDLDVFERCQELVRHPLIYNGDIVDCAGFRLLEQRFDKVRGWMIGRGLLADPFLAMRLKGESMPDRRQVLALFSEELFAAYGERLAGPGHLLGRMKSFWHYLAGSFRREDKVRKQILKARKVEVFQERVARIFEEEELRDLD